MESSEHFPENVRVALANEQLRRHLSTIMPALRQRGHGALLAGWRPEFERLRERAREIRAETIAHLGRYVDEFETKVKAVGGTVYRARDAADANRYVIELAKQRGIHSAVKAKSMTSEEIRLNEALGPAGIEPIETDLGQLINQLAGDDPFHMVGPAIHHSRGQVADLFQKKLAAEHTVELQALVKIARRHLRQKFCEAGMGISGANFGIAETGTVVLCENEGNIGLSTTLPRVHVVLMGLEKVLPRLADLPILVKLLARAGGGFPMFRYVSLLTGRRGPGGPEELHVVLLDNGRSRMARDPEMSEALRCIRCGACQGACPIYTQVGGHAYGSIYQGPIGSIVSTQLEGFAPADHLPQASTLCGACADVCPVKIPIPHLLLELRQRGARRAAGRRLERLAIFFWALTMRSLLLYRFVTALAKLGHRLLAGRRVPRFFPLAGPWSVGRELPPPEKKTFHRLWRERARGRR
jgi:L-lactate dehydrogenase complex protein LldF